MPEYKWPGVYIEEQPATGPIAGVGTSTAAFIGAAKDGPVNAPVKVTNWTAFVNGFGDYMVAPRSYLAYAVRSFFENNGAVAYVVRAGSAAAAAVDLADDSGTANRHALRVEALTSGPAGNSITVTVAHSSLASAAEIRRHSAPIGVADPETVVQMKSAGDASGFAADDWVTIDGSAERAQVERVAGDEVHLKTAFTGAHAVDSLLRIADVENQRSFRVVDAAGLQAGSTVHISDGAAANPEEEDAVVASVDGSWVTLDAPVTKRYDLSPGATKATLQSREFDLRVTGDTGPEPPLNGLAMDPRHSRYWSRVVASSLVRIVAPRAGSASTASPPRNRPKAAANIKLTGGKLDTVPPTTKQLQTALDTLENVDDINLVCVPGATDTTFQNAVVAHCEKLGDRFAILDSAVGLTPFPTGAAPSGSVLEHRQALSSPDGYGALYYPWLRMTDPASATGADEVLVPPSGAIAGIFARTDAGPGVHKAPANEEVRNAFGLELALTDAVHGDLNIEGVNVIRMFQGIGRPVVWGARTIAPRDETAWRYVNVRRLMLYIEESLQEGLRPRVFDPNDLGLWKRLERTVSEFLGRIWRAGALFGATADEAFYVKIDEETTPEPVRALGQVVIEIGVAVIRPAEFVIVRIGLWPGPTQP